MNDNSIDHDAVARLIREFTESREAGNLREQSEEFSARLRQQAEIAARRQAEQMQQRVQEQIMSDPNGEPDPHLVDTVNATRFGGQIPQRRRRRGEIVLGSEKPEENELVNLYKLRKMIEAICSYLEVDIVDNTPGEGARYEYKVVKRPKKYKKNPNRQEDLIIGDDDAKGSRSKA